MLAAAAKLYGLLTSPTLPGEILAACAAIAVVIIVAGVGIWGIVGAWKVFLILVGGVGK